MATTTKQHSKRISETTSIVYRSLVALAPTGVLELTQKYKNNNSVCVFSLILASSYVFHRNLG